MNHSHEDDIRWLVRRQMRRRQVVRGSAKVISLRPGLAEPHSLEGIHSSRVWRAVAYAMLGLAAALVMAAGIELCMRSGNEILGRLTPGWPWW